MCKNIVNNGTKEKKQEVAIMVVAEKEKGLKPAAPVLCFFRKVFSQARLPHLGVSFPRLPRAEHHHR